MKPRNLPQMENDLMEITVNQSDFIFEDDFESIKEEPLENSEHEDPAAAPIIAEFIVRQKNGPQTLLTRTIPKPPLMWTTNSAFIDHMIQFGVSEIQKTFPFNVMRQHRLDLRFKNPEIHYQTTINNQPQNFHFEHPHSLKPTQIKPPILQNIDGKPHAQIRVFLNYRMTNHAAKDLAEDQIVKPIIQAVMNAKRYWTTMTLPPELDIQPRPTTPPIRPPSPKRPSPTPHQNPNNWAQMSQQLYTSPYSPTPSTSNTHNQGHHSQHLTHSDLRHRVTERQHQQRTESRPTPFQRRRGYMTMEAAATTDKQNRPTKYY